MKLPLLTLAFLTALLAGSSVSGRLVAAEPAKSIELFNGKDLTGWRLKGDAAKSKWVVGTAALDPADPTRIVVTPGGHELINAAVGPHGDSINIHTEATFSDAIVELEVMVPQKANSGVVLMGIYEIQVLDSFGRAKPGTGDMGAVYGLIPPRVNAAKPAGEWQKLQVQYRAARFDATGQKTANACIVKAVLNDQLIHENAEPAKITAAFLANREVESGALLLQGDHGPVAFRNIRITPLAGR